MHRSTDEYNEEKTKGIENSHLFLGFINDKIRLSILF
tara:strand:- start:26717 stop:26827 length:111 start_codon:yes stop_codon:yes gene_type:complete